MTFTPREQGRALEHVAQPAEVAGPVAAAQRFDVRSCPSPPRPTVISRRRVRKVATPQACLSTANGLSSGGPTGVGFRELKGYVQAKIMALQRRGRAT